MALADRLRRFAASQLPPSWRLIDYRGFRVCHVEGEDLIRHLRAGRYEERSVETVAAWHGDGRVGLDIGANIGFFRLGVLASRPGGRILAFEPNPLTYSRLRLTLELNGLGDTLEALPLALADASGVLPFARHDPKSSSGDGLVDTGRAGPAETLVVPVATLDSVLEAHGLRRLDWIKIDVEGAELRVFEGARKTLETLRPRLLFEAHPINLESHGLEPRQLFGLLDSLGYRIAALDAPERVLDPGGFEAKVAAREENFIGTPSRPGAAAEP
ncbi:MAG: FkbM family methyltransferase [Acidobacteriota bacterium]